MVSGEVTPFRGPDSSTMDEDGTINSILGARRSERKPPVFTPRSRSMEDLPGGIKVPIVKRSEPRLKTKLQATLAGLEELNFLRERHQKMVNDAKLTPSPKRGHGVPGRSDTKVARGPMKAFRRYSSSSGVLADISEDRQPPPLPARRASCDPDGISGIRRPLSPDEARIIDTEMNNSSSVLGANNQTLSKSSESTISSNSGSCSSGSQSGRSTPEVDDIDSAAKRYLAKRLLTKSNSFSVVNMKRNENTENVHPSLIAQQSSPFRPQLRRASVQCEAVLTSSKVNTNVLPEAGASYNFPSPLHAVLRQYNSATKLDQSGTGTSALQKMAAHTNSLSHSKRTFETIGENSSLGTITEEGKHLRALHSGLVGDQRPPQKPLQRRHSFDIHTSGKTALHPKDKMHNTVSASQGNCHLSGNFVKESVVIEYDSERNMFQSEVDKILTVSNKKNKVGAVELGSSCLQTSNSPGAVNVCEEENLSNDSSSVSSEKNSVSGVKSHLSTNSPFSEMDNKESVLDPKSDNVSISSANDNCQNIEVLSVSLEDEVFQEPLVSDSSSACTSTESVDDSKKRNCDTGSGVNDTPKPEDKVSDFLDTDNPNEQKSPSDLNESKINDTSHSNQQFMHLEEGGVITIATGEEKESQSLRKRSMSQESIRRSVSNQHSRTFPNLRTRAMSADVNASIDNSYQTSQTTTVSETLKSNNPRSVSVSTASDQTGSGNEHPPTSQAARGNSHIMDTNSRLMYQLGNAGYTDRRKNNLSVDEGYAPSIISSKYSLISDEGYSASVPSSKCSFASDESFRYSSSSGRKDNRKLSIQSDFTWISTDMDDTYSSIDCFHFSPTGSRETDCFTISSPQEMKAETSNSGTDISDSSSSKKTRNLKPLLETAL